MLLKTCAIVFGIIMLVVGILGFFEEVTPRGLLLGLFHVNPPHNLIHILTGIVSLICGLRSEKASRIFFQVFGVVYGIVAILGFFYGDKYILGFIANNMADNILHVLIAIVALGLGFGCCCKCGAKHRDDLNVIPPRDRDLDRDRKL